MKLKKIFLTVLIFSLAGLCFAQEADVPETTVVEPVETTDETTDETAVETTDEVNIKGEEFAHAETFGAFIRSLDFVTDLGPLQYVNIHSKDVDDEGLLVCAPSPINYPVTIGIIWPNYTFVSMEPTLTYFQQYYLWYDGLALPAEVEHATASTHHFLVNLPVVVQLYMKNSRFQFSLGGAVLMRFGLLPSDVKADDEGFTGTAGGDLPLINDWFWQNCRYLYLSTGFSWLYNTYHNVKAGPTIKVYVPVSSMVYKEGLQGMMVDIGLKISL